jgi:ATP synthase protein I
MRDLSTVGSVGFTLVAFVLVFTLIGYGLDRLLGTRPWLMVVGVFVGAALGFISMVRTLIEADRRDKEREELDEPPGP